jgi:hypothetical protein
VIRPVKVDLTREEARLVMEKLRRHDFGTCPSESDRLLALDIEGRIADALEASLVWSAGPGRGRR